MKGSWNVGLLGSHQNARRMLRLPGDGFETNLPNREMAQWSGRLLWEWTLSTPAKLLELFGLDNASRPLPSSLGVPVSNENTWPRILALDTGSG